MQRERLNANPPRRARSLWDETRKPNAPWSSYLNAILYEIQPIRFSTIHSSTIGQTIRNSPTTIQSILFKTIPNWINVGWKLISQLSIKQWMIVFGLIVYWRMVVYLHDLLHAGPIVLIITALVIIFTVGLGDNAHNEEGEGYVSAYSVFNRGFQSILGSLDADQLLAQHVGGGGVVAAAAAVNAMDVRGGNDFDVDDRGHGQDGQRGRQQQQQQQQDQAQQQQEQPAGNNNNNNNNNNQNRNNKSRKSGKKARRKRNVEQKREQMREMELQREAAAAMGFGMNDNMDIVAMNRLIEEQAAEAARMNRVREDELDFGNE